ncbi:MAG TPA: hypothetical protein DD766_05530 [Desulfovibrio sp.]|nr:hypothetical protein [Desulfovibrio sp.]
MSANREELVQALEAARKAQAALDRRNYHLHALFEVTQELSSIPQPQKILETFLLLTLGPLGLSRGLTMVAREGEEAMSAWRGLEDEVPALRTALPPLLQRPKTGGPPRGVLLAEESGDVRKAFPGTLEGAVFWDQDGQYQGVLAVGGKISGEPLDRQDLDTLLTLVNVLIASLRHALSTASVRQLNSDLTKRNEELHQALDRARRVQGLLDRQVFHLKGMNDLADELSILGDTGALLNAFLLHELGAFGVDKGFLLLVDRGTRTVASVHRGMPSADMDFAAADRLLYRSFDAAELRALTSMSVSRVRDPSRVCVSAGLPPGLTTAVFFVIEQSCLGLVALGDKLGGGALSRGEAELLSAQTASLMAFVKNTRSLETIRGLNEDLQRRNDELQATIRSLTDARRAIALLERARERIKGLVQREAERVNRASVLDFIFMLVIAAALGLLFNFAGASGIPLVPDHWGASEPPRVQPAEAVQILSRGGLLVDARPQELYRQQHAAGAVNVPAALFDMAYMLKLGSQDLERPIVVYGRTISRRYDAEVVRRLSVRDHANVRLLDGGLEAWRAAGQGVEP